MLLTSPGCLAFSVLLGFFLSCADLVDLEQATMQAYDVNLTWILLFKILWLYYD